MVLLLNKDSPVGTDDVENVAAAQTTASVKDGTA